MESRSDILKIVFATSNPHKLKELNEIVKSCGVVNIEFVLPPSEFDPVEDGKTFEENSFIKAKEASRLTGMLALADDSGLCVDCLDGAPGIYSARYAKTPQDRIDKLLNAVEPFENRRAKFVCAMTLTDGNGNIIFADRGECLGEISKIQAGKGGFGYDPLFLLPNGKTMAEISIEEKNKISHRFIALNQLREYLINNK